MEEAGIDPSLLTFDSSHCSPSYVTAGQQCGGICAITLFGTLVDTTYCEPGNAHSLTRQVSDAKISVLQSMSN